MKQPILLETILDIAFWVLILGLVGAIIFSATFVFFDLPLDFKINGYEITEFTIPIIFGIIGKFIIAVLFVYIVYLLRKVVRSFFKKKIFTPVQVENFKLIGQLIIVSTVADSTLDFFLKLFIEGEAFFSVGLGGSFGSFWITIALGLFFILLSGAFNYAAGLQEENELTV